MGLSYKEMRLDAFKQGFLLALKLNDIEYSHNKYWQYIADDLNEKGWLYEG